MKIVAFNEARHLTKARDIYNYYVANTTISFHTAEVTLDEMRVNVCNPNPRYKTYVIEVEGEMAGYALFTQHKNKQAYDVTAEVTVYLAPEQAGNRLGPSAVAFLEEEARKIGFHTLVATICTENERSIRLFERLGYEKCAHFKEVGFKFGRRLDIASYQKVLGE
ncbi:GNAT family N-acetyltransferase [Paenibacillus methanolicus]|uniref:Phosphinothricin acetyltransferase n=1 Tax=Paenibacillus methanolicus TaxID=582686 RepID=A0A5S5C8E9_9BACL|nr:GNAT family N-acetyltransferase [Paenibacillus methanolicus]TYP75587.1 phosphinothricin acetyltransferase [Paenibacillus methanolicus]